MGSSSPRCSPTSPLILHPFTDPMVVPQTLAPVAASVVSSWVDRPWPGLGQQNSLHNETHQLWTSDIGSPDPLIYEIDLLVRPHSFTSSQVLPIDSNGQPTVSFDANGKPLSSSTGATRCGPSRPGTSASRPPTRTSPRPGPAGTPPTAPSSATTPT